MKLPRSLVLSHNEDEQRRHTSFSKIRGTDGVATPILKFLVLIHLYVVRSILDEVSYHGKDKIVS